LNFFKRIIKYYFVFLTLSFLNGEVYLEYWPNDSLKLKAELINGNKDGKCEYFNLKGKVWKYEIYQNGKVIDKMVWQMFKPKQSDIDALEIKSHNPADTKIAQIDSVAIPPKISETNIENDNNPLLKGYTGNWIEYYDNGALKCVIEYMNGLKHGKANYYDEEKRLIRTERYLSGKKHGKWIWYWGNKKVKEVGYYNTDKKQGKWFKYDSNGNEILVKNFY